MAARCLGWSEKPGRELAQRCPFCQSEQRDSARYCDQCRSRLQRVDTTRLTPLDLDALAARNAGLFVRAADLASFRVVTTLFCDLHGFTAMSEKIGSPEKITALMNGCFDVLTRAIVSRGGTIDKYTGDNIMALFGAPAAQEDDAERAVRAAFDMFAALKQYNETLYRESQITLEMRIGINTGSVVAGLVGGVSYGEYSYTVMGDPVNLASRLEHAAPVGGILVGQTTYRLTNTVFDFERLPPMTVRGKHDPVQTYLVKGLLAQRGDGRGLQALNQRVPLVGRARELAALDAALDAAVAGQGQTVMLTGEAGLGKTVLMREFTRRTEARLPTVRRVKTTAYPYTTTIPYSLIRSLFFEMAGIAETDTEPTSRRKLFGLVEQVLAAQPGETPRYTGNDIAEILALVGEAVGVTFQNSFIESLEPRLRKQLLLDAIHDVLLAAATGQPLLLTLDDLHWADAASLEIVDRLVRSVVAGQPRSRDAARTGPVSATPPGLHRERLVAAPQRAVPVLLVLVYRPDMAHVWPVAPDRMRRIALNRLDGEQARELARQWLRATRDVRPERLLSQDTAATPIKANNTTNLNALVEDYDEAIGLLTRLDRLVATANGNPLFIEEIIKALQVDRRLVPSTTARGGWRLVGTNTERPVPETLFEILLARIDRLDPPTRRLLQIAAVIGQRFSRRLLQAVAPAVLPSQADFSFDDTLAQLTRLDFIRPSSRADTDQEYLFVHSLTREVAYNNLLEAERKRYHTIVAPVIEQFYADAGRLAEVTDELARHYRATDMHAKAVHYLTLVGDKRRALADNDAALRDYREARARLEKHGTPDPARAHALLDLNTAIGDLLSLDLDYPGALDSYHHALDAVDDVARAEPHDAARWRATRLTLWSKVILMLTRKGESDEARAAYEDARLLVRGTESAALAPAEKLALARLLSVSGYTYHQVADYDRALEAYQAGVALLTELQDGDADLEQQRQLEQGVLHQRLGLIYSRTGNIGATELHWFAARDLFTALKDYERLARLFNNLATLATTRRDWAKTGEYLELADTYAQRSGAKEVLLATLINLGYVRERQGDLAAAAAHYSRAAKLYEQAGDKLNLANAHMSLGRVLYMQHKLEQATDVLRHSRTLAEATSALAIKAEADLYYGATMLAQGDLDEAEAALNAAYANARAVSDSTLLNLATLFMSQLHLAEGETADALALAQRVRAAAERTGDVVLQGVAFRTEADIHTADGAKPQAAQAFQTALRLLSATDAPFERALTQHAYGTFLLTMRPATGRNSTETKAQVEGRALLAESAAFLANADATGWTERTAARVTA